MAIDIELEVCFKEPSNSIFAVSTDIIATAPSNFEHDPNQFTFRDLLLAERVGGFLFAEMVDISDGSLLSEIMTDKEDPEAINITSELNNVSSYVYGKIKNTFPGLTFTIKQETESSSQNRSLLIYRVRIKKKNGKLGTFRFYPEVHSWNIVEKTIRGIIEKKEETK
jgi:uncharacterized protein YdhG (YjbR/CyaY superfamily)